MEKIKALNEFTRQLEVWNYSAKNIYAKKNTILRFLNYYKDIILVTDFEKKHMEQYLEYLKDYTINKYDFKLKKFVSLHYTKATVNKHLSALRVFFKYLCDVKILHKNIMDYFDNYKKRIALNREGLKESEVELLFKVVNENTTKGYRDKCILETFYGTGMRLSELTGLDVDDIYFNTDVIHIRLGKGRKDRMLPLPKFLRETMLYYLEHIRPSLLNFNYDEKAIFLTEQGLRITSRTVYDLLKKYVIKSEIKRHVTPHIFRHTFAIHLLKNGAPLRYIQELLGHSRIDTTMVYTKIVPVALQEKINEYHPICQDDFPEITLCIPKNLKRMMRWESKKQEKNDV